jgi:hypothetical protein
MAAIAVDLQVREQTNDLIQETDHLIRERRAGSSNRQRRTEDCRAGLRSLLRPDLKTNLVRLDDQTEQVKMDLGRS